jgi:hypothetical protein
VQGVHPPCTLTEVNVTGDPSADADYELGRQIGVLFAELATTVVTAVGLLDAGLIVEARELLSCRVECPPPPAVRAYLRRKLD